MSGELDAPPAHPPVSCHHVTLVENLPVARDVYRARLDCPEIARTILPGQFVMLRSTDSDDPLLGRAFALYDTYEDAAGRPRGIDVVYAVVGKFTSLLSRYAAGRELLIWGPLGNGFVASTCEHLVMVAGGIGHTPFRALAKEVRRLKRYGQPPRAPRQARRVTLCYGARSAAYLAGLDDFRSTGIDVMIATDDGSHGHRGFVTDLLKQLLACSPGGTALGSPDARSQITGAGVQSGTRVICCGPERMMESVAHLTAAAGVPCEVSLESPMACGVGICFSCVTRVWVGDGEWDYRRTCVDGPVFDAARIAW
jgi:dihydroorotate dehydrogenase electron transfer subunit